MSRTTIIASDGVDLAVSVTGDGAPVVFIHEFSGDLLSWAPQVAELQVQFRCISFNARGYPPSQVPDDVEAYQQARAADDVVDVMNALGIADAHLVGLSMGGFAALHVAIRNPLRVRSLVVAGCGYGARPADQAAYFDAMNRDADHAEAIGMRAYADELAASPYATALRGKDESAWLQFLAQLRDHSAKGMAMTLRGVLARRPSLWHLERELAAIVQPALLIFGEDDEPCREPNFFMKKTLPNSALAIMPRTGHLPNLEEPAAFNALVRKMLTAVSDGTWSQVKETIA